MSKKKSTTLKNPTSFSEITNFLNNAKNPLSFKQQILPQGHNQTKLVEAYHAGFNLFIHGYPGTGKTLLTMNLALKEVMISDSRDKLIIVRSVVPSRDMGFLPGSAKDKARVFEAPYLDICTELFGNKHAYDTMKMNSRIVFSTTSFLRGLTFTNAVVYIDEIQNLNAQEMFTILSRIGVNTRVVISGDINQSDLTREHSSFGLIQKICLKMPSFCDIALGVDDILRSPFVKEFIIAKEQVENDSP